MRAIYRMVPFSVTLSDLEGHFSAVVTLCAQLTCDVSDSCVSGVGLHKFYIKLSLCGPSCGGGSRDTYYARLSVRQFVCPLPPLTQERNGLPVRTVGSQKPDTYD